MPDRPPPRSDDAQDDLVLRRILEAAGLPMTGRYQRRAGWVSRAWIGDEHVVRLTTDARFRDAYAHEAEVVALLEGSEVPHARHVAHGDGPDGPWYISERLPGQTLHEAWPTADPVARQSMIESLGAALRALHRVPAPEGLMPPWLSRALDGGIWPAYHPPVVGRIHDLLEAAMLSERYDRSLFVDLSAWIHERIPLVAASEHVLVHGDLHGSNVMVA
ncbi:phosphotransferase family protein, partial [Brachybacterium sp.]|uniref:phosphotransferase family protein n=1 Tax=Brachybacterium sp. TaxID=1891286 RepID=UPI002ED2B2D9